MPREMTNRLCANCAKPVRPWQRYCWLCGLFGGQRRVTGVFKVNGEVPQPIPPPEEGQRDVTDSIDIEPP